MSLSIGKGGGVAIVNGSSVPSFEDDPIVGAISGIIKADGSGHISTAVNGTDYIDPSGVTFANLNANGDVGTGALQVAAGNHLHSGIYLGFGTAHSASAVLADAYITVLIGTAVYGINAKKL